MSENTDRAPAKRRAGTCAVLLALAGTVLALLLPSSALAADVTANFDGFPPGTVIADQYATLGGAGQGVTFGPLPGAGGRGYKPVVAAPPAGEASSMPHIGDFSVCDLGGPQQCGELYAPVTTGTFASGRTKVSVRVGLGGDPVTACTERTFCADVSLQAYDANGDPLGPADVKTVLRGAGYKTLLTVTSAEGRIRGFKIGALGSNDLGEAVGMDDLTFDVPSTPPQRDFTLTPETSFLVMAQGTTLTDRIDIARTTTSSGNIDFELTGPLPAGVRAEFVPNPAGGTSASTQLRITADPTSATTGFTPIELTVTGKPRAATAGTDPRSFKISLQVRSAFELSVPAGDVDLASCVARVPVAVHRDDRFAGPVSLSVTGAVNGIQAMFEASQLVVTGPATGLQVPPTTLTVRASAPGYADRTATVTVRGTCPAQYDARITSLEITQGVQSEVLPQRYPEFPANPILYSDIPNRATLRQGAPTVVRVYANLVHGPQGGVPNVPVVLHGSVFDQIGNLKALPGSPITPMNGTRTLQLGPALPTQAEAKSELDVYTFVLPAEWTTRGNLRVSARLLPSLGGGSHAVKPCETEACKADDAMGLRGIPFVAARPVTVKPLEMTVDGAALPDPTNVFSEARMASPLELRVQPYQTTIDVTDLRDDFVACNAAAPTGPDGADARLECSDDANGGVADRVHDYTCDHPTSGSTWNVGVNTGVARGLKSTHWCFGAFGLEDDAVVEVTRPLTSVAHELGHLLGRPHADLLCGGNSNGEGGEAWPPDDKGHLQSVGLATDFGTGVNGGPFKVMAPPKQWFDYMSYCADEGNAWISVRNWNRILGKFDFQRAQPADGQAAQAPKRASLHVRGSVAPSGTSIVDVEPVQARPASAQGAAHRLVGFDATGARVAEAGLFANEVHVDGRPPIVALDGVIPAADVVRVAIVRDGAEAATRTRSAEAPRGRLLGTPRFRSGRAVVRSTARDGDGDALLATLAYSAGGGRFHRVWTGPHRSRLRISARQLTRSSRGRLRLTLSDGFNETSSTSKRFRSPGSAPSVHIVSPAKRIRQSNDAPLTLGGQAYDEHSKAITGRRLQWFMGRRRLGTGARITVTGLPAGDHRIRLVARDARGRTGSDGVAVTLTGARPLFLSLAAPGSVKASARTVRLTVASSLAAVLRVTGTGRAAQAFRVARAPRELRVRVRPAGRPLALRLRLRAAGRTSTRTVTIGRG